MAVLQVLHFPDERLRTVAQPVKEVTPEIQRIVDDMFETMYAEEGIGLAATQVDVHQRIIVIDVSENHDQRLVLINPELLSSEGETGIEEGCLSVPEHRALVPRAERVKFVLSIAKVNLSSLKQTICSLSVFSMKWII